MRGRKRCECDLDCGKEMPIIDQMWLLRYWTFGNVNNILNSVAKSFIYLDIEALNEASGLGVCEVKIPIKEGLVTWRGLVALEFEKL